MQLFVPPIPHTTPSTPSPCKASFHPPFCNSTSHSPLIHFPITIHFHTTPHSIPHPHNRPHFTHLYSNPHSPSPSQSQASHSTLIPLRPLASPRPPQPHSKGQHLYSFPFTHVLPSHFNIARPPSHPPAQVPFRQDTYPPTYPPARKLPRPPPHSPSAPSPPSLGSPLMSLRGDIYSLTMVISTGIGLAASPPKSPGTECRVGESLRKASCA